MQETSLSAPGLTLHIYLDVLLHIPLAVIAFTDVIPFIPKLHVMYCQLRVEVVNCVAASWQGSPTAQPTYRGLRSGNEGHNGKVYFRAENVVNISLWWFARQARL